MQIDYREDNLWTLYLHIVPKELSGYDYDKYYVGITKQRPQKRWGGNGVNYKSMHFSRAIEKYGWNNIQHIIIANNLTHDEANKFEKTLISKLNSNGKYGYNVSDGGDGGNKKVMYPVNQYDLQGNFIASYESAAEAIRALNIENAHRSRITHCCKKGDPFTTSTYGYMWSYSDCNIPIHPYRRSNQVPVNQFDLNHNFIKRWDSISEAASYYKILPDSIIKTCQGKYHMSCNSKWEYAKEVA